MSESAEKRVADGALALHSRRKFLKRALLTAAYVAPVILSYPSTVFAAHCSNPVCGGADHKQAGMFWSPGCSAL